MIQQHSETPRALLLKRFATDKIAKRLTRNASSLSRDSSRLNTSMSRSDKSHSQVTVKRTYSLSDIKVDKSRSMLLQNIVSKLKEARLSMQTGMKEKQKKKNKGKLDEMLKDIKRCNQLSTKAVYSIKKHHIDQGFQKGAVSKQQPEFDIYFKQLKQMKEEIKKVRQQNQLLLQLVTRKHSVSGKCWHCGCNCSIRHRFQ